MTVENDVDKFCSNFTLLLNGHFRLCHLLFRKGGFCHHPAPLPTLNFHSASKEVAIHTTTFGCLNEVFPTTLAFFSASSPKPAPKQPHGKPLSPHFPCTSTDKFPRISYALCTVYSSLEFILQLQHSMCRLCYRLH